MAIQATTVEPAEAAALRQRLVEELRTAGSIQSPELVAAFATVPRHLFAPGVALSEAYANDVVRTKLDGHGVTISSVSAPWLQAEMLEQAEIEPGMRCLEIGSGGYNAALLAELVGPTGQVTTMDIDRDVTDRARECLHAAGYDHVQVVLADGEHGVPDHAPYDRIIVTVGVWDVPPAWTQQLADDGRIVVPLRMRGLSRSVCLARDGDRLASVSHAMAGFVDVQGAGARRERLVLLHEQDVALRFDDTTQVEADALSRALTRHREQAWSGVRFAGMEPFDGLMLWLATVLPDYGLLTRTGSDTAKALVDPASPIGTPALLSGDSFAYLTFRAVDADRYEFGAYAHGPSGQALAEAMCEQVRRWDRDHRHGARARITVYPAATAPDRLPGGRVIGQRHTKIVISWPNA
jgi:protein-L-isoaspartate(D-aspartate) O-methyltransferase